MKNRRMSKPVKKRWIPFIFGILALLPLSTFAQINFSDTISYEIVKEKMIIAVKVNGLDTRFIYDSGGRPWIMKSEAERLGIVSSGYTTVSDLNNKNALQHSGDIKEIQLSKNFIKKNVITVISGDYNYFKGLGVAGLLNNEYFSDVAVTILPREKKMVLSPFKPAWVNRADGIPVTVLPNYGFMLPLQMENRTIVALFDTGMSGLLNISNQQIKTIDTGLIAKTNSLYGIGGIGINGLPDNNTFYKVVIKKFKLGNKVFEQVGGTTQAMNSNIMGIDLLQYGNVVLDIPRQKFYFYPFEQKPSNLGGAAQTWNVNIIGFKDHFEISGLWSSPASKIALGDRVININGTSLKDFPKDDYEIERVMREIKGNKAYIIIEKNGKQVKMPIEKVK